MSGAPPAEVVIGLDVGTTAAKAVGFGLGSPWRHSAVREYPLAQPEPGHQVQDPDVVVEAATSGLAECVSAAGGARVIAVSVGTAMHGLIGLDEAMQPITPLLTWADSRAHEEARALHTSGQSDELHRISGTPVHPMSPLTKLMWFARHDPITCSRARWWVGLKDHLLQRLSGTLVTELSSASATGLLDLASRDWSPPALQLAGVRRAQLPDVLPTTAVLGLSAATAVRVGLPPGTPVVVGAADGPLANLGAGAVLPGVAGLSLGTSGAVRMVVDRPVVDVDGGLFCYALTPDHWVVGGAISNGAHVVRWAADALAPDLARTTGDDPADEALLALAGEAPPGSDGLVMLPYLIAERAPLWAADVPGAYVGLHRRHTRAHLVRAAVEGVSLQLSAVVDRLDALEPVVAVRAVGGAFRAPLWRTSVAAALDRPLHLDTDAGGGALGAAALGLHALGRAPWLEEAPALLLPPGEHPPPVVAAPEHVSAFDRLRRDVPALVAALSALPPVPGGRVPPPAPRPRRVERSGAPRAT